VMIEIVLAPARSSEFDARAPPLHLCLHDLHRIHALQSIAGEGIACNINDIPFDEVSTATPCALIKMLESSCCDFDMARLVYQLQNSDMTDEECLLKWFMHQQLKCLNQCQSMGVPKCITYSLDKQRKA